MVRWHPNQPFMKKTKREVGVFWPADGDVNDWLMLQRRALRKAKTPEQRHKINLIIEEFLKLKEQL